MRSGAFSPKATRVCLWLLFLSVFCSCGQTDRHVVFTLAGDLGSAAVIRVRPSLPGRAGQEIQLAPSQLRFQLLLPADAMGTFQIVVDALDSNACKLASGMDSFTIDQDTSFPLDRTIEMPTPPVALCTLYLTVTSGPGRVVPTPGADLCASEDSAMRSCEQDFPRGTQVSLQAIPGLDAASFRWSNVCESAPQCVVTMDRSSTIQLQFTPRICSPGGWCWHNPRPQGQTLRSMWGSGPSDIWAVGDAGTILHYDGNVWSGSGGVTKSDLLGVWGSSASDIWAVGSPGVFLHYDGKSWQVFQDASNLSLEAVWGSGPQDVWSVGAGGAILHFKGGSTWEPDTSGAAGSTALHGIWGSSATDIRAVGDSGLILQFNGSQWSTVASGSTETLRAIWGSAANDAWTVGSKGTILHWDGMQWTAAPVPAQSPLLTAVFGTGSSDVWAVGQDGTVLRYRGTSWSPIQGASGMGDFFAIWGSGTQRIFFAGSDGTTWQWDGSILLPLFPGSYKDLYGIWASGPQEAFAVGESGTALRFDGQRWTQVPTTVPSRLAAIWGSRSDDLWAVGDNGRVLRWNGSGWSVFSICNLGSTISGIWGSNANDVWMVGNSGTVQRFDGTQCQALPAFTFSHLRTVSGTSRTNVWVAGEGGTVGYWNGSAWMPMTPDANYTWTGIRVGSTTDVSIAGRSSGLQPDGRVLRYDGTTWSMQLSSSAALNALWGSGPDNMWAVGDFGTIWRFDGTSWTASQSGTQRALSSVWGSSTSGVWVGGEQGNILHHW